ncbi:DUF721 domain-containing protein [Cellulomonas sp. PhB143]|uniref:DUF721 domain-containing protein n=1 Tax=Cellulomonas sp. PhB143 TaxID=2485186 RepID=UPI000F9F3B96|nr:DciA family protein [Cellulomonas sp. PhB143]ROS75551.1 putative nucleic acid-binding Zn ribbon protein [Cellulomonas sp. PhB143]
MSTTDPGPEPADEPAEGAGTGTGTGPEDDDGTGGRALDELVDLTPPATVAKQALDRARAGARARGLRPGKRVPNPLADGPRPGGPGARDPQLFGEVVTSFLSHRGWTPDVTVGGVVGRWREVVGDQVADHCTPETFEDHVLVVRTDSSAWAAQVKILVPRLLQRLAEEVGDGVVHDVRVLGPAGPSFRRGPRTVRGPGPRDTWG